MTNRFPARFKLFARSATALREACIANHIIEHQHLATVYIGIDDQVNPKDLTAYLGHNIGCAVILQLAAIIAEETEAYIWEKGGDLKSVKVEVREVDGVLLPWSAELGCPYGEAISRTLSEDLGIPRERQRYEGD